MKNQPSIFLSLTCVFSLAITPLFSPSGQSPATDFVYNDVDAYESNTLLLQNLLDQGGVLHLDNPGGNSTLYIDQVHLRQNIQVQGNGLVIKRAPVLASILSLNQLKWHRLMYTQKTVPVDSIRVEDLTLDGSLLEMGIPYSNYEVEQSALLFLASASQMNVELDRCHFRNNGGDGVHVRMNIQFKMTHCSGTDCFRGVLTSTGGNSVLMVDHLDTFGPNIPTGIDFETDGGGGPNGNIFTVKAHLSNLNIDTDFDLGVKDGSSILIENLNLRAPGFWVSLENSEATFNHCTIRNGNIDRNLGRIRAYHNLTFNHCSFIAVGPEGGRKSCLPIVEDAGFTQQNLRFNNCEFVADRNSLGADLVSAVPLEVSRLDRYNTKTFSYCAFDASLDYGIHTYQGTCGVGRGNKVIIDHCLFQSDYGLYFRGQANHPFDLTISDTEFKGAHAMYLRVFPPTQFENAIRFQNVELAEAHNRIITRANNLDTALKNYGYRKIIGQQVPTGNTHGFPGDEYHYQGQIWLCTKAGYFYGVEAPDCEPLPTNYQLETSQWKPLN